MSAEEWTTQEARHQAVRTVAATASGLFRHRDDVELRWQTAAEQYAALTAPETAMGTITEQEGRSHAHLSASLARLCDDHHIGLTQTGKHLHDSLQATTRVWNDFDSLRCDGESDIEKARSAHAKVSERLDRTHRKYSRAEREHNQFREAIILASANEELTWLVNQEVFQLGAKQRPGKGKAVYRDRKRVEQAAEKRSFNLVTLTQLEFRCQNHQLSADERGRWGQVKAHLLRNSLPITALLPVDQELRKGRLVYAHGGEERNKTTKKQLESWAQMFFSRTPGVLSTIYKLLDILVMFTGEEEVLKARKSFEDLM